MDSGVMLPVGGVTEEEYDSLPLDGFDWLCPGCLFNQMPLDTDVCTNKKAVTKRP